MFLLDDVDAGQEIIEFFKKIQLLDALTIRQLWFNILSGGFKFESDIIYYINIYYPKRIAFKINKLEIIRNRDHIMQISF